MLHEFRGGVVAHIALSGKVGNIFVQFLQLRGEIGGKREGTIKEGEPFCVGRGTVDSVSST